MAASVTLTPSDPQVGDAILIDGDGYLPATKVTVTITPPDKEAFTLDIKTDATGSFSTTDEADAAVATLTSSGVQVTADDTVTIGAVTYTFKVAVTTTANEVKMGTNAADTLVNLYNAINLTGVAGKYGSLTVIHPTVTAVSYTTTTVLLAAKTAGTGGNSLGFSKSAATLSVSGANFAGGAATTGYNEIKFTANQLGVHTVSATDGSTTASATVQVFSG